MVIGLPAASGDAGGRLTASARQARVADPEISAWVSANAGTGKTYVLVRRVLRLLLAGATPGSILCLTFTKAAAAEMVGRVMRELGGWASASTQALSTAVAGLLERAPTAEELATARCLFAKVLDSGGGLKIMTIHAFCERLLRRFPLEAGVAPTFVLLTEEEQRAALGEAVNAVLMRAAGSRDTDLGRALAVAVAHAAEDRFETLLEGMVRKREDFRALIRYCGDHEPFAHIGHLLRRALGVGEATSAEAIVAEQLALLPDAMIGRAVPVLASGGKRDIELAEAVGAVRGKTGRQRLAAMARALLTKDGTPRADGGFISKGVRKDAPDVERALCTARDRFAELERHRVAADTVEATLALLRLADAVIARYDEALAERGALDFDRIIARTGDLLQRSSTADWVLYRLDADLAHLLVDEAQDTSPAQWELVKALTAEFFSGEGAEKVRTLFAVGDEKQSIYGFQGAEPKAFAAHGRHFAARAHAAEARFTAETFTVSRRSTSAVLESVDRVFSGAAANGLTADGAAINHEAHRLGEAGLVEIWPTVKAEKADGAPPWEPFAEGAGGAEPSSALAERIARQVRHWLDAGEILVSENRPVTAGDILILVRKRKPFADRMVKALKEHGIPVAGADRMRLTAQLGVMDLMVLGDVLLLPEDDLALATLLKAPFFGFDDDDLFAIGHGRAGSLWRALHAAVPLKAAYGAAVARLELWRAEAGRRTPFEFYSARLEEDGLRAALLARLGPDAADAIAEFLNLTLIHEAGCPPTLQGFLHWLRIADPEVKRDMEQRRDEVRVMTVHGSKGLEAPIVFLADTCAFKAGENGIAALTMRSAPPEAPKLPVWVLKGARRLEAVAEASEAAKRADREEYHRLLYVAMTRARDRLYIAGFENGLGRAKGCWWDLVSEGLADGLEAVEDCFGAPVRRMETRQTASLAARRERAVSASHAPAPDWSRRAAPEESAAAARPAMTAIPGAALDAAPRGRLARRLLETLPALAPKDWPRAGARLLAAEGAAMPEDIRQDIIAGVSAILAEPRWAALFGRESRAGVTLGMMLEGGAGECRVDRLLVDDARVLFLNYAADGDGPAAPETVPPACLARLAACRAALALAWPGRRLSAGLLWLNAPAVLEVSDVMLDVAAGGRVAAA